jgi:hypothetical protein
MHIDARNLDQQELFARLKEILSSNRECGVSIEILIGTSAEAKKVEAFASMSGCRTETEKKDDHYTVHLKVISSIRTKLIPKA